MALTELFSARKSCTTCPYCGVGCGVAATQESQPGGGEAVIRIQGDEQHPANKGKLCVKGSSLADTLGNHGRLLKPRLHGEDCDWETALDYAASQFRETIDTYGPDSVAFYLSGQLLTEDYYVANKLMKGFIGTGNVDTNSRLCMSSAVAAYKRALGADAVPCNYEDLDEAELVVLIGSNAAWTHPILFQRMQAAQAKLVVVDPRGSATSEMADMHLAITPGSDAALFNGLLHYLTEFGALDQGFIDNHTENFSDTLYAAAEWTPEKVADYCAVDLDELLAFYELFRSTEKTTSFYSQGVNQSSSGTDKNNSIINCHLATGRIGKPGCGPFSITGQPNAMGGREVGGLANMLAAHMDFTEDNIDRVGRFWNAAKMAQGPGLKAVELFNAVESGQIKAVWIMATNPAVSMPDARRVAAALKKCPTVIVSDCVADTDTARCADLLLPATTWGEKSGTVTNSERRISRQKSFLPKPGEARHDWEIICDVAKRLGYGEAFDYQGPADIFREHAALSGFENNRDQGRRAFDISALATISDQEYNFFTPLQWPVNAANPNGTARLFSDGDFYTPNGRARFVAVDPQCPKQETRDEYPLIMNSGRLRDQWHTMTRTGRARKLLDHSEAPEVHVHPQEAQEFGIEDAQLVRVESEKGQFFGRARVTASQKPGQLFAPIHWSDSLAHNATVSALALPFTDPLSGQPELKQVAVNIAPLNAHSYACLLLRTKTAEELHSRLQAGDKPLRQTILHWYRVPVEGGYRFELALSKQPDWQAIADNLFALHGKQLNRQRLQLPSGERWLLHSEQMELLVFTSADWQTLPDRKTLEDALNKPLPAMPAQLLQNVPAGAQMVCTCLQVSRKQIEAAIADGAASVDELGELLGCGTNCGSCKPEISALLNTNLAVAVG
ncbi:nitrate reductase [Microbulbifer hydrolyticus]|uniref:Assimilatory nitrate reductase catalytic subunit n=1 Tax=Microbulbifer hydrolyticus TaxID=48074 RepID=A0A6P1TES7_9GAMM|nr:nitrate reductase [Microbulbifer hydrolyticus]MBB5212416.1 assimilatory nitrate reductase catalytic subunit [Microbulbifer hydrolyticus]QHQ40050.1 molybdopterin-dependent oxidoreductase [Microbulbifer hydrolyticus]